MFENLAILNITGLARPKPLGWSSSGALNPVFRFSPVRARALLPCGGSTTSGGGASKSRHFGLQMGQKGFSIFYHKIDHLWFWNSEKCDLRFLKNKNSSTIFEKIIFKKIFGIFFAWFFSQMISWSLKQFSKFFYSMIQYFFLEAKLIYNKRDSCMKTCFLRLDF